MTVSGLSTLYNTSSTSGTQSTSSVASNLADILSASESNSTNSTSTADLSDPGKLLAELKKLKETDPTKFKETVTKISEDLKKAASDAGDTAQGKALSKLADQFQKVADTGDLSALQPPPPPSAGGPPAAYSSSKDTDTLLKALSSKDSQSSSTSASDSLKSIFAQIESQVSQALSSAS